MEQAIIMEQGKTYIVKQARSNSPFIIKITVIEITKTTYYLKNNDTGINFRALITDFLYNHNICEEITSAVNAECPAEQGLKEISPALYSDKKIPISKYFEVLAYNVKGNQFWLKPDGYYHNGRGDIFYKHEPLHAEAWSVKRSLDGAVFTIHDLNPDTKAKLECFLLNTDEGEIKYGNGVISKINSCKAPVEPSGKKQGCPDKKYSQSEVDAICKDAFDAGRDRIGGFWNEQIKNWKYPSYSDYQKTAKLKSFSPNINTNDTGKELSSQPTEQTTPSGKGYREWEIRSVISILCDRNDPKNLIIKCQDNMFRLGGGGAFSENQIAFSEEELTSCNYYEINSALRHVDNSLFTVGKPAKSYYGGGVLRGTIKEIHRDGTIVCLNLIPGESDWQRNISNFNCYETIEPDIDLKCSWEIQSFLKADSVLRLSNYKYRNKLNSIGLKNSLLFKFPIHAVKRLSDNEVFTIGDIDQFGTITGFEITGNCIFVQHERGQSQLCYLVKSQKNSQKESPAITKGDDTPFFITEDGKNIPCMGECVIVELPAYNISKAIKLDNIKRPNQIYFSTYESARWYVIENSPISIKELQEIQKSNNIHGHVLISYAISLVSSRVPYKIPSNE